MTETIRGIAALERAVARHPSAEVRNIEHMKDDEHPHPHTDAMCRTLASLIEAFGERKLVAFVETELLSTGKWSRPEDFVVWIEGVGIIVVEIKSHAIDGIRSFENNIPQVMYKGGPVADKDLLEQPKSFAYALKSKLEEACDDAGLKPPALFFAGWLPNVSRTDVFARGAAIADDKVWLDDMLHREVFLARLPKMKNLTKSEGAPRATLEVLCSLFGCSSGLRQDGTHRPGISPASLGRAVDERKLALRRLTREQELLAFSPVLTKGPKVIRGVAGSGKTVVLANAVAEVFLRHQSRRTGELFSAASSAPSVAVFCFNRTLAPYLRGLIEQCFELRKPDESFELPTDPGQLLITNIDRYASGLVYKRDGGDAVARFWNQPIESRARCLVEEGYLESIAYSHVFVDEGQDIDLAWYELLRHMVRPNESDGPSLVVFYDEAQNIYGVKRPGVKSVPPWKVLLGREPNPRGLKTKMLVGHRNTNQILSFSFDLLLGAFAERDPQMVEYSGLSEYEDIGVPTDPLLNHPNQGRKCVERLDSRHFRVNFALSQGPVPVVHRAASEAEILDGLSREIRRLTDARQDAVEPHDVLIMAREKEDVIRIVKAFETAGIPCFTPNKPREGSHDFRDEPFFQPGRVTVSTCKAAKGHSAFVCHLVFLERFDPAALSKQDSEQRARAELHVACTRAILVLEVWGTDCELLNEAEQAAKDVEFMPEKRAS